MTRREITGRKTSPDTTAREQHRMHAVSSGRNTYVMHMRISDGYAARTRYVTSGFRSTLG